MSQAHPSTPPQSCANCGHAAQGHFCAECGQKTHIEIPTLWEFIHEYLHHYVSLEGALTRSLWLLVARPGHLTGEYLRGRRQRYVKPFQLYLSISFIFFVQLGLLSGPVVRFDAPPAPAAAQPAMRDGLPSKEKASPLLAAGDGGEVSVGRTGIAQVDEWLGQWGRYLDRKLNAFRVHPAEANAELLHSLRGHAPYALFGLMPMFALLLWLAYFGRHRVYGAHLVFTLHFHSWLFLVLCLGFVLPAVSGWLFFAGTPVYLWLAQRRVYGGGKLAIAFKTLGLLLTYTVLVCLGMALLLAVSL